MQMLKINIISDRPGWLPVYATPGAAAMDLRASLPDSAIPIIIGPGSRRLIKCGFKLELPDGYEAQVRSRSGLAIKHGIFVLNAPGTVDPDYRGDMGVILANFGEKEFEVRDGDRIAQMIVTPFPRVVWNLVEELPETTRGVNGFGSTGVS